ncbi:MAG TPA: tRNA guanosine(34) transglycosylase Tgt [Verrucomicrobiae bacterium]|nr:tRNA guanosine(34) transglycosylase Tgt [Verrucomicrobiae bacterium]
MIEYELHAVEPRGFARAGLLRTPHGDVRTPAFMPVGTYGAVKALTPGELVACGARMILGNTYHLYLRPGHETVRALGGLHRFASWDGAILTDSGGFQIFSLASFRDVGEEGVVFRSHLDGSTHRLTPELSIGIQEALGSDVMMALDVCPALPSSKEEIAAAVSRTVRWAQRCLDHRSGGQALFGIVQGGTHEDLRAESAGLTTALPFDGFAIGGVSVGESREEIDRIVAFTAPRLPREKARYLMGVGTPRDLLAGIAAGIDMFDCVMPTRNARNGTLFTWAGPVSIKRREFAEDPRPLDDRCGCDACRNFSRAYLRHLFQSKEILSMRLNTIHNVHFYQELMRRAREAIVAGRFAGWAASVLPGLERAAADPEA